MAKPGKWPDKQRFDFVVRVRPLEAKEIAQIHKADASRRAMSLSEHKRALLFALEELTGLNYGHAVREWKELVRNDWWKASPVGRKERGKVLCQQ